jgi:hypothetical protein
MSAGWGYVPVLSGRREAVKKAGGAMGRKQRSAASWMQREFSTISLNNFSTKDRADERLVQQFPSIGQQHHIDYVKGFFWLGFFRTLIFIGVGNYGRRYIQTYAAVLSRAASAFNPVSFGPGLALRRKLGEHGSQHARTADELYNDILQPKLAGIYVQRVVI